MYLILRQALIIIIKNTILLSLIILPVEISLSF